MIKALLEADELWMILNWTNANQSKCSVPRVVSAHILNWLYCMLYEYLIYIHSRFISQKHTSTFRNEYHNEKMQALLMRIDFPHASMTVG